LLPRGGARPAASFSDALSAGGGILVWIGALLIGLDLYGENGDGWPGALLFLGLGVIAGIVLRSAPREVEPAAVSTLVLSVPSVYGFLIFPSVDSFGDVRGFFALTIATYAVLFFVWKTRGRPVFLGLAAALLWLWVLGEVADTGAYSAAPIPSPPYATPAAFLDAARGGDIDARGAGFGSPDVTLDDLDRSDPLYPLAESCAEGDFTACDALWTESELGSDFETFAESCGGDDSETYPCASDRSDDVDGGVDRDFDGGFGDDLGEELLPTPSDPFEVTPLGEQDDQALEIGLVSLLFGAAYLAAVRVLDRRRSVAFATALVLPAITALVTAAAALGDASGWAVLGGLLTFAVGVAFGVVGFAGRDRRFTSWGGGITASIGALVIAADVSPTSAAGDTDELTATGLIVLAFGLAVAGAAWFARRVLAPDAPPSVPPRADASEMSEP
jgi:hypothetical protein